MAGRNKAKTSSSVRDKFSAPNFGSRFLTDNEDVFSQNAWDHVPPPTDQEAKVADALARQRKAPVPESEKPKYNDKPARHWDIFYKHNENNFFRDRKWLHLEFPELVAATQAQAGPVTILEVGCGAGNSMFPLLSSNVNLELKIVACDYSPRAVELVKSHALYDSPPAGRISASVWDLSSPQLPQDVLPGSVDIVVMIFVLSALHPKEWRQAIENVHKALKPGGKVVLRDYGRYDLAQLRFKEGRLLDDNFYIRGDKTRVYFFSLDDLAVIFTGSPVPDQENTNHTTTTVVETEVITPDPATPSGAGVGWERGTASPSPVSHAYPPVKEDEELASSLQESFPPPQSPHSHPLPVDAASASLDPASLQHPLFSIEQLGVDNRLIVNRKRQLKMHRVWMQGKFVKLPSKQDI
ncbi:methyltransferase [Hysterangium stoloniferum]|nr:methyltransferase [Hysterangium stoloniferum]